MKKRGRKTKKKESIRTPFKSIKEEEEEEAKDKDVESRWEFCVEDKRVLRGKKKKNGKKLRV